MENEADKLRGDDIPSGERIPFDSNIKVDDIPNGIIPSGPAFG